VGTVTSDGVEYKMQNGQVVFDPTFRGFKLLAIGREVEFFPGKRSNGDLLALYVTGPEGKPLKKRAEEAKKIATIKPGPLRRVNRVPGRTNTRLVKPAAARRFGSLPFPPIPFPPPLPTCCVPVLLVGECLCFEAGVYPGGVEREDGFRVPCLVAAGCP